MVMASTRVWLLAAVFACMLLVRSADADGVGVFGCNPLTDKTCRPGDPRAPENQEEGGFGARMPSVPGSGGAIGGGDADDDDELPSFDSHLTILGH